MAFRYPSFNRRGFVGLAGSAAAFLSCACGRAHAQQPEKGGAIPGGEKSAKSTMLGAGADLLQSRGPVSAINMYLNGFHFYADDMGRQIEAHHYCSHVTEEFYQCVIYDGNEAHSRLIGIEYIVTERIFKSLPEEEKALWHSHRHEALAGELLMPGIPATVQHIAMATLVSTYGKTWHTWQIDKDSALPNGIPQLMMGFTADGQLKPEMIKSRDKELGTYTSQAKKSREDLASSAPQPDAAADAWKSGTTPQLVLTKTPIINKR
jgi:hypothetical protein